MKLIIDATVLFTAFIGEGVTKEIIFSKVIELYAPQYLFEEFYEHKLMIKEISGLSEYEIEELLNELKSRITIVSKEEFDMFLEKASFLVKDKDDTEYIALSLSMNNIPIWSNDSHFKEQLIVKVFTTTELVKHLKSLGYTF